jgi:hypothetical protein
MRAHHTPGMSDSEEQSTTDVEMEQPPQEPGIQRIPPRDISVVSKLGDALNDQNWQVWKERMKRVLCLDISKITSHLFGPSVAVGRGKRAGSREGFALLKGKA